MKWKSYVIFLAQNILNLSIKSVCKSLRKYIFSYVLSENVEADSLFQVDCNLQPQLVNSIRLWPNSSFGSILYPRGLDDGWEKTVGRKLAFLTCQVSVEKEGKGGRSPPLLIK